MARFAAHAPQRAGVAQVQQHALFGDGRVDGQLARQRRAGGRTGRRSGNALGAGQRQGYRDERGTQRRAGFPAGRAARRRPPAGEAVRGVGFPQPVIGQRQQTRAVLGRLAQRRGAARFHPQRARHDADRAEGGQRQEREHGQRGSHRICGSHMQPIVRIKGPCTRGAIGWPAVLFGRLAVGSLRHFLRKAPRGRPDCSAARCAEWIKGLPRAEYFAIDAFQARGHAYITGRECSRAENLAGSNNSGCDGRFE